MIEIIALYQLIFWASYSDVDAIRHERAGFE